ncbi:hypothetical protein WEI85_37335 [Actinomycetes bacterium KLBMP 9797]
MQLTVNDAIATALVASGVGLYIAVQQGVPLEFVTGPRSLAAVLLLIGFAACVTGGSRLADESLSIVDVALVSVSAALGTVLLLGVVVMATGSEFLLGVFLTAMIALWALATARHALASRPRRTTSARRRIPHP